MIRDYLPLLNDGDPEPGGWAPREDMPHLRVWKGSDWARMHGATRVEYGLGLLKLASPVILPDGRAVTARRTMEVYYKDEGKTPEHDYDFWRVDLEDGSVLRGSLVADGAGPLRFNSVQIEPRAWGEDYPMFQAMAASNNIRGLVKDRAFAVELYRALSNTELRKIDDAQGEPFYCSWRTAGRIVADLREMNEEYLDFYCSGGEGEVSEAVASALETIGWRAISDIGGD